MGRIFLLALLLFSCSPGKKEMVNKKIITLWETYNNEEHEVFCQLVKEFEKENPDIQVRVQRIPWGEHLTKLKVAMITNTAPDIARVDLAFMPRLVKSRSVLNLVPFGAQELVGELVPAAINANIFSENYFDEKSTSSRPGIYGLPDQTTGVALFYNKKLFRQAGIAEPPKTWSEFIEVGKKLTNPAKGQYGFAADLALWWTFPFFNTYGVKLISDDGKRCLLNDDRARQALQLKVDLYRKYHIEAGAWQAGAIPPDTGFINGTYAMIFSGPWNLKRFKNAGLDFGVALIPRGPAGTSTNVGGTDMVVLRRAKYPSECFRFLKYFCSATTQAKWATLLGQIPVNLKSYPLVDLKDMPELKVFMEQMKTAIPRPPVLDYDELENVMGREMYAALSGQKTVEEALADAVKDIDRRVLTFE